MLTLRLTTKPGQRSDGTVDVYYVWRHRDEYMLQTYEDESLP